jgi:4-oxalocrotonate tautomerase
MPRQPKKGVAMEKLASRRGFLKKSITIMGAVTVYSYIISYSASALKASEAQGLKAKIMPHVSLKMYPGRSEKEKAALAEAIVQDVMDIIGAGKSSISVAIEDVSPEEWKEKVYDPEIMKKSDKLSIKRGYSM